MLKNKKIIALFFIILFIFFFFFIYYKTLNSYSDKKINDINLEESSVIVVSEQTTEITSSNTISEQTTQLYYNESYLSHIKIDDECKIYAYMEFKGEEYDYAIFGISYNENKNFDEDEEFSYNKILYWEIVVLKNNSIVTVLRDYKDDYADIFDSENEIKNRLVEKDVNFDGKNDILLFRGHYGNQGFVSYSCYLQTENKFELCESFSEIPNPVIDKENKVILCYWRNWAASHSIGKYYFIDGKFIEKERLTEEPIETYSDEEETKWSWTIEEFSNGKWVKKEYFTEENYEDSKIGSNSAWDFGRDSCEHIYE